MNMALLQNHMIWHNQTYVAEVMIILGNRWGKIENIEISNAFKKGCGVASGVHRESVASD